MITTCNQTQVQSLIEHSAVLKGAFINIITLIQHVKASQFKTRREKKHDIRQKNKRLSTIIQTQWDTDQPYSF